MNNLRFPLLLPIMAVAVLGSVSAVSAQAPIGGNCNYFPKTGHYVCDEFLEFHIARGGTEIFGHPLTEAFDDTARGLWVQYFQRVRMELHPHARAPRKVQLGLLIDELDHRFPPASPGRVSVFSSALHRLFPETNRVVSYAFLDYFREQGGLDIFGYPRSEFKYEGGYTVQYFQRARMEWHPESPLGRKIRLTNLGEIYIEEIGVPESVRRRVSPPSFPVREEPSDLHVTASVQRVIAGRDGVQTVFVYVIDQQSEPVEGADVTMVIRYPATDGPYEFGPTDSTGFTRASFELLPSPPGRRVVIEVTAVHNDLESVTEAFFLSWQ